MRLPCTNKQCTPSVSSSADKRGVPKVDNTNIDRSIATIHATVLGCLRRRAAGAPLFDPASGTCKPVLEEYLRCRR